MGGWSAHRRHAANAPTSIPSLPPNSSRLLLAEARQFTPTEWGWIDAERVLDAALTRGGWLNFCRDHKILPLAQRLVVRDCTARLNRRLMPTSNDFNLFLV